MNKKKSRSAEWGYIHRQCVRILSPIVNRCNVILYQWYKKLWETSNEVACFIHG